MASFDISKLQRGMDPNAGYCVDIAMLIDATGSMSPIISEVKANALKFCEKFHRSMEDSGKNVEELRIKVIPFRDYGCDGAFAMSESEFFVLPEQNAAFEEFVNNIKAEGGGDEPESSLEALALAMRSDWTTKGSKRRHVILMFTDASAHPLGDPESVKNPTYPPDMPKNLAELGEMWAGAGQEARGMPDSRAARLVVFAPDCTPWNDLQLWNNYWPSFSKAGTGLDDVDIDMAINLLVGSVG